MTGDAFINLKNWAIGELERKKRLLGLFESGKMTIGESTDGHAMRDTTAEQIETLKSDISQLEYLLNN
jgi:hypothetical protein